MKIRGLLAVLVMAVAVIYFVMFLKTNKKESPPIKAQVDRFLKTKIEMTKVNMSTLDNALQLYIGSQGTCPKDLNALISSGTLMGLPADSWGRPFRYERLTDSTLRITSAGQDGQFGTEDDISIER